ncbi:MAG: MmcQ/YjbR family DNA-binding protein [Myxococcales bacterium]|nr:MmcQ/YjbR family DNA-binding protein [Myxococcales bacterium]MCB9737158.1 MmcQ/YjbR family DNA-binding protein [Deltaproteobacteria bacterium]
MSTLDQPAIDAILRGIHAFGLAFPGVHFKSPWPGHMDLAVNDKTFAYLSLEGQPLGVGVKLPYSAGAALLLPYAKPMAYGLGRSGWVSFSFSADHPPDVGLIEAWVEESYRAQAPKKLVKQLDAARGGA